MPVPRKYLAALVAVVAAAGCTSSKGLDGTRSSTDTVGSEQPSSPTSADVAVTDVSVVVSTPAAPTVVLPTSGTDAPASTGSASPAPPVPLVEPPAPMVLAGTPQEQIIQLADAFERRDASRAPALLAAFGAAGIAVVDADERPLTTLSQTVGMPWVFVYTASSAPNSDARIPLSEVARIFAADGIEPQVDVAAVGADLVNGLRAALAGDGSMPGPTIIAMLVQEEARRAGGVDLADPTVPAEQISVSVPTAALLVSAGVLIATSRHTATAHPPDSLLTGERVRADGQLPPGCATDSDGQWALWLVSKIAAGTDIPGLGWEGIFGTVINHLESFYPGGAPPGLGQLKAGFGKVASVAGFGAAALTALSAIIAKLTYSADVKLKEGEPLIRTKKSGADGKSGTIVVKVGFDYGALDESSLNAVNCLLSVLVVLGNNSTLPTSGPAKGVTVTIEGLEGFGHGLVTEGSFVLLNTPLTKDTDDAGVAEFSVVGRRQRTDIPDSAPPVDRVFTVAVEAQPDPTDADGLSKIFFDSFLCAGGALGRKGHGMCRPDRRHLAADEVGFWACGDSGWSTGRRTTRSTRCWRVCTSPPQNAPALPAHGSSR